MSAPQSNANPMPEHPCEGDVITSDLDGLHLSGDVFGDTPNRPLRPKIRQKIRPKPELVLQKLRKDMREGS